ncbi:Mu-like prophage major head subunit gpT family protein [Roseiarcaceae bacterium H3SJ34-1]|uniref:prohead protease/major capsid protein fusion protein n=1 Tax=Terripilifer ovatus TaxID=3032367 RepID=UPI003AB91AF7|nr:Mu-like prophage major head subunit gpT family protein [Roseiarcaceae bacterium H3SJ34-1]
MNAIVRAAHAFRPKSIDDEARSVELIASTGAGVIRQDFDGPFTEVLQVSAAAIDLSRAEGMPLLDSHRQDGLDRILGVVRSVRLEGGNLIVKVEFSPRANAVWQDVRAGIITNVSVGYRPIEWRDSEGPQGRIRTLTRWELHEVSLVAVGADPQAKTRNLPMPNPTPVTPETTTVPVIVSRAAVNAEIRALAETFNLGTAWANELIDASATEEQARARAVEAVRASNTQPAPRVAIMTQHEGDPSAFTRNAVSALYVSRVNPRAEMPEPARRFAHMTTLDLAREALALRGIATTGLSAADTIGRALTTSDFPAVLGGVGERVLREAYAQVPAALKSVARQTTAKDFKAKSSIQLGDAPMLEKVNEHGEFKYGALADAKESYAIDTFGKIVSLTRKAIVNDDLGAFTDLSGAMGRAAQDFEAQFLVNLLIMASGAGPTMDDGVALFHANHNNLGTPVALYPSSGSVWTSLSAARLAMRKQTSLGGRPVSPEPKFLLVPPELETKAEALLAALTPASAGDVNPFAGKLTPLVEPRLTSATAWYVIADPASVPGLEYAYLQGFEGPQIETRAGFEVDGVETKVRLDFGAGFVDWRGWQRNAGA